jgi:hypothetical protein
MRLRSALRQPWIVLWPLVAVQWLLVLVLTQRIVHDGWLFAQDGSGTRFYSTAWSFAHGRLPPALVGYGWPLVTTPLAGIAGMDFLDGLPVLVLLQTVFLLPLALLAVYGIASRIGGRGFGYFTAAVWVVLPFAVHPLFGSSYHGIYVERMLPDALGLTGLGEFPSSMCVLVAAYFALVSIDSGERSDALLAGLVAGLAIAFDPGNVLFLAAPAVGYALARRPLPALAFGIALLPALVTVALWQYRGLGSVHLAAAIDPHRLEQLRLDFRSVFYSDRLVELAFLAGVLALGRRSWTKAGFIAAWFLAYLLVRGSEAGASIPSGRWFGALMPAYPAFVIAICAIPLLVPRVGARLSRARSAPLPRVLRDGHRRLAAAVIAFALLPFAVVGALPAQASARTVAYPTEHAEVPVDDLLRPTASVDGAGVTLTWSARKAVAGTPFYTIFRSLADGSGGLQCDPGGPSRCSLSLLPIGTSLGTSYLDPTSTLPSLNAKWTYRVGVAANAHVDPAEGGLVLLSPPIDVAGP